MLALLAFPFKLAGLLLHVVFGLLRTAVGLAGLLLNPFVLIVIAIIALVLLLG